MMTVTVTTINNSQHRNKIDNDDDYDDSHSDDDQ
jgi:hypothetical protein